LHNSLKNAIKKKFDFITIVLSDRIFVVREKKSKKLEGVLRLKIGLKMSFFIANSIPCGIAILLAIIWGSFRQNFKYFFRL